MTWVGPARFPDCISTSRKQCRAGWEASNGLLDSGPTIAIGLEGEGGVGIGVLDGNAADRAHRQFAIGVSDRDGAGRGDAGNAGKADRVALLEIDDGCRELGCIVEQKSGFG